MCSSSRVPLLLTKITSFKCSNSTGICIGPTGLAGFPEFTGEIRCNKGLRFITINVSRYRTESRDLQIQRTDTSQHKASLLHSQRRLKVKSCYVDVCFRELLVCQTQSYCSADHCPLPDVYLLCINVRLYIFHSIK
jgi:hypothetical protein